MSLLLNHHSSLFQTAKAPLRGRFAARLPGFVALMKPRVMSLAVFTAFVGLAIAPGHLDPLLASVAIGAIAAGAGAAGVRNMRDADIDAMMARALGVQFLVGRSRAPRRLYSGLSLPAAPWPSLLLHSISRPPRCTPLRSSSMSLFTRCGRSVSRAL
jgi:heme O synthase-like polyprenyltransferase